MPNPALQLLGRSIGADQSLTQLQSDICGRLNPHKCPLMLHTSRKLSRCTAASLRKSNLIAAASYSSLSPTNGAARPASPSAPPATQQPRPAVPLVDHSKATIKVQQNADRLSVLLHCTAKTCLRHFIAGDWCWGRWIKCSQPHAAERLARCRVLDC